MCTLIPRGELVAGWVWEADGDMSAFVDYEALFGAAPNPCLVLDPDLVVVEANGAYAEVAGRSREELLGRSVVEALAADGGGLGPEGARRLRASLLRVLREQVADEMPVQRYNLPRPGRPGGVEGRWWSVVNVPVLDRDGGVEWIMHQVQDLTDLADALPVAASFGSRVAAGDGPPSLGAAFYAQARGLLRLTEGLQEANAREQRVAITLQQAMLHAPDLDRHRDIAVRYLPAVASLNVCGDWYDVVDLSSDHYTVAVGDVVGHGLKAAAVMGMLRSALSAAMRALERPGQALDVLDVYAASIDDALGTTAVKTIIDTRNQLVTYSSAGHLPPVLVHGDGRHEFLDQATEPPLGAFNLREPRRQASTGYDPGDLLVLYTDGLVERRGECLDLGLGRLADALTRHRALPTEELADVLLDKLGVSHGGADDIALVVIRL